MTAYPMPWSVACNEGRLVSYIPPHSPPVTRFGDCRSTISLPVLKSATTGLPRTLTYGCYIVQHAKRTSHPTHLSLSNKCQCTNLATQTREHVVLLQHQISSAYVQTYGSHVFAPGYLHQRLYLALFDILAVGVFDGRHELCVFYHDNGVRPCREGAACVDAEYRPPGNFLCKWSRFPGQHIVHSGRVRSYWQCYRWL